MKESQIGFHVEEKYYAMRKAQAEAFAQYRANEWGRSVDVTFNSPDGTGFIIIDTKRPKPHE